MKEYNLDFDQNMANLLYCKKYKKSFKVWFSDLGKNGVRYNLNKYDQDLECDECKNKGSWFIVNEKYKIGLCDNCLKLFESEARDFSLDNYCFRITIAENEDFKDLIPDDYNDLSASQQQAIINKLIKENPEFAEFLRRIADC